MLAQPSLKDSELRYRRLFESTQDGILILHAETGMIEDVNPYLIKMLGYSREEFVEKKLWEVGAFKDVEASKAAFEALQDREYIRYEDLPLKAKDGRLIQVEFVSNVYLAGGEKIIQCNIRDITEHKRIIVALQANERKYFSLLNQSSDGIFIIDLSGNIRTVNKAMCSELEFSQEEFLSMKIWDIFPKQYIDQYRERLTKILAGDTFEEPREYEVRGKDGRHHYVEILSTPHYSGRDIVGFQGIARDITGRKQLQEKLRESEKKYRDLVEMSHDLIWAVDVEGRITYMSPVSRSVYGREPEEMIGHLYTNFVPPDEAKRGMAELASALAAGADTLEYENRVNHRDGHEVVLSANAHVQRDAAGNIVGMVGISRDITAHKLADEALQASEARNRNLIEHLPTVVYMNAVGDTSSTLYVSPQIETLLGYTSQEWLADPKLWSKTLHPEDSQHVLTRTQRADLSNEPFEMEYRMIARDGRMVWVHDQIVLVNDLAGKPQFWQGIMLDITERKMAEEALRASEEKYRIIVETSAEGMWVVDKAWKTTYVNPAIATMFGYAADEMLGRSPVEFIDQEENPKVSGMIQRREKGITEKTEVRMRRKDGTLLWTYGTSVPILNDQGEFAGGISLLADVTERKHSEAALRESEERFRRAIQDAPYPIQIHAEDGEVITINQSWTDLTGYDLSDIPTIEAWTERAYPDRASALQEEINGLYNATGRVDEGEDDIHTSSGEIRTWKFSSVPIGKLPDGRRLVTSMAVDITERKRAEESLQKEKDRAQQYLDIAGVIFLVLAADRKVVLINKKGCETLGYVEQDIVGQDWIDQFLPQGERNRTGAAFDQIMAGEIELVEYHENPILTKSGQERLVAWNNSALTDESGRTIGIVSSGEDITERRRAEESLRKSQLLLRATGKMARVGGWEFDVATVSVVWTEEVYEIHGVGPDYEPAITKWINLFAPEAIPVLAQAMQRAIDHGKPFDLELPIFPGQGTRRWVHIMGQAQQSNGRTTKLSGVFQDITERRQAEEALRESESSLQGILSSTADGILAANSENKTLFTNGRFKEMWRIPQSLLDSKDDSLLIQYVLDQLSDPVAYLKKVQDLYKSEDESFDTLYFKDGRVFERLSHPLMRQQASHPLIKKPELRGRVWSFRDVTTRKQAEVARDQLASIVDASQDAILGKTLDGIITSWNRGAERLYRYSAEEAIGQSISFIIPPDRSNELLYILDSIQRGEPIEHYDTVRVRKDGERIHISITVSPIMDSIGHIVGASTIARDITERKQSEDALSASEERLRQVWEATSDAMGLSDPQGILLAANPAYLELYGYTSEQVIGRSFSVIFPEGSREQAVEQYRKVFASELIAPSFESAIQRSDGTGRFVEAEATFLTTNGVRTAMLSTIRDITLRKQAEQKIHQQLQHLTALRAIDQVIAANFDLRLSLSEIIAHVIRELEVDASAILLLNSSSQMLEYGAQLGFRTRTIKKLPMRLSSSYAGRVVLERKSIQVQNPGDGQANLFPGTPLETEDFVFYYGVPLITKGQIKGVLEVFHRTALEPDAEWFNFLHNLASQAAIAIENAVLFDSLQRSNLELSMAYDATIEGWSRALDLRDKETEGHTQRVTEMTQKLARAFGVPESELLHIRWGSLLHDIGKMGIPDGILLKPAALSDEEWVIMQKHPVFAYEMLSPIRYLQQSLDIPYCHHEKWDGTGYPRGLKGEMIPLSARIFAVVDVWDALRSDRPYRAGWPEEKVSAHIRALSGTHFDPQVVDAFMRSLN